MLNKIIDWCGSNTPTAKCTRTIFQGIIGVIIANIDVLLGCAFIDPSMRPIVAALVMAVLSPIQAALGSVTLPDCDYEEADA